MDKDGGSQGVVGLDELDQQLVDRAPLREAAAAGDDGLLSQLTKMIIESAAEGEMDDHLGYAKHDPAGRDAATPATAIAPSNCSGTGRGCVAVVVCDVFVT